MQPKAREYPGGMPKGYGQTNGAIGKPGLANFTKNHSYANAFTDIFKC